MEPVAAAAEPGARILLPFLRRWRRRRRLIGTRTGRRLAPERCAGWGLLLCRARRLQVLVQQQGRRHQKEQRCSRCSRQRLHRVSWACCLPHVPLQPLPAPAYRPLLPCCVRRWAPEAAARRPVPPRCPDWCTQFVQRWQQRGCGCAGAACVGNAGAASARAPARTRTRVCPPLSLYLPIPVLGWPATSAGCWAPRWPVAHPQLLHPC